MRRLSDSTVCDNGSVLTWTGPSEVAVFNVWGSGAGLYGLHPSIIRSLAGRMTC
jgi:hypothetical protein